MVKESNEIAEIRCKSKNFEGTALECVQIQSRRAEESVGMVTVTIGIISNE